VFIKKLFGKKNDGFYLQLEDDKAPKPAAKTKVESKPAPAASPTAAVVEAAPVAPPAVAATTPTAPAAKSDVKAEAAAAKAEKKSVKKAEAVPAPAPVVAPAPAAPPITNFATDYLIKPSSTSTRRRPGANMNSYLDMARQATKQAPFKK
jgi:hypothetical protein